MAWPPPGQIVPTTADGFPRRAAGLTVNFGFNTNVQLEGALYHVQTEDHSSRHPPYIETTVYLSGQVLHRRTTSYQELIGGNAASGPLLKHLIERQHRSVVEELRAGRLRLDTHAPPVVAAPHPGIRLELLNSTGWLAAGQATLQVAVRGEADHAPVAGAAVDVYLEGALTPAHYVATTDGDGRVELRFPMPPLGPEGGALGIRANASGAQAELRYRLRAKTPAPVHPAS